MRTITLFTCAAALVPQPFAPPTPPKPSTPVRLPAYEQPNLVTQTEVCAELPPVTSSSDERSTTHLYVERDVN